MPQISSLPILHRQRGVVLFVALVFLILITLLGLTASSTSIMQERMTGGMRNSQLAMMGAESAARGAESWIWNLSNNSGNLNCGYNGGNNGFCYQGQSGAGPGGTTVMVNNPVVNTFRTSPTWLPLASSGGTAYTKPMTGLSQATASLSQQPQYLIEDLGLVLPPGTNQNGQGGSTQRDCESCKGPGIQKLESYRITARSTGGSNASVAAVEVYFGAMPPSN